MRGRLQRIQQPVASVGRSDEKPPRVVTAGSQNVQIPSQAGDRVALPSARDGQPPALRERRGLQSQSEAAEVVGGPLVERVLVPQPHGTVQTRVVHAPAIILDGDVAVGPFPHERQVDVPGAGSNAVVDESSRDPAGPRSWRQRVAARDGIVLMPSSTVHVATPREATPPGEARSLPAEAASIL